MTQHTGPTRGTDTVTFSVSHTVYPGREADYEAWLRGITKVAAQFDGQQGVSILRPSGLSGGRYILIYRFDTQQHAHAWEQSPEHAEWLIKLKGIAQIDPDRKSATGLEVWFDLPEAKQPAQPPRHKMAVVLIAVIFSLVFALQALLIVTLKVLAMTYVIMPTLTSLLQKWLFRKAQHAGG
jgi:antibiotic biosynthesis monooxygenase (ABM) superfamily enzyme